MHYKGTNLYLKGKASKLQGFGYNDFKTKRDSESFENVYKCCAANSKFSSKYEDIAGKTFKVLNVEKIKTKTKLGTYMDMGYFLMQLQNIEDNSIAYFEFNKEHNYSFPFIDMRFFNKIKQTTVNKDYVVKENSFNIGQPIDDVNGKIVDSVWSYSWKCVDVLVEEKYYTLSLLLENANKTKIVFDAENINDQQFIIPFEKAEIYKNEFGDYWVSILKNKVVLGMNETMVKIAWGKPKNINQTIVEGAATQQWVYGSGNYVYFKNGIVESMQ